MKRITAFLLPLVMASAAEAHQGPHLHPHWLTSWIVGAVALSLGAAAMYAWLGRGK